MLRAIPIVPVRGRWNSVEVVGVQAHDRPPVRAGPNPRSRSPFVFEKPECESKMDSDPNAIVRKRLHVAGLTPAVSVSDLSQRLGTFGTVVTIDGLGALDGLGRPRPFAYVTIEAKNSQLARCMCFSLFHTLRDKLKMIGMNLLSGTTWKGAKLRIGEAKPDFRERYDVSHPYGPW